MAKRYIEQLAAWSKERGPNRRKRRQDTATVAFMAVKSDVQEAIAAGYALTTIYEHMHEIRKVRCSYETFRQHVRRYIKEAGPASHQAATRESNRPPVITPSKKKPTAGKRKAGDIAGFQFNPVPNEEELF